MTEVELPAIMFELGGYTVESFSASANAQAGEDLDQGARTFSTNSTFDRASLGR